MATKKIDPELRAFGEELKTRRLRAGLNQAQLATLVNVTRSYIGQIERGDTRCRRDFTERADRALNCENALINAWDELLKESKYPKYFVSFPSLEATAVRLCAYEAFYVYGLFQTETYARALLGNEEAVNGRMKRQQILKRSFGPMFSVILDEGVLYRQIGTREVMGEQLEFLVELSCREKVKLQVAPFAYYEGVRGSFQIATQGNRSEAVYMVNATGGQTSTEPADLVSVTETMATLQAEALNVKDTRVLLRKVIAERWT